ncbi:MAG TPA: hypothetical protein VFS40_02630 [Gemmatimonadales bacterium]|nr:hypothetical protein [Gemmatimonadales bacterium]
MLRIALVALAALALAGVTYFGLERLGRRALLPALLRAVAWTALGLLLLNVSCPTPPAAHRPLVLLDGSLSMTAEAAARDSARRWPALLAEARRTGEVRTFGDERPGGDTLPERGRSLLAPALAAASASDRPVLVVTDGEIEDASDIPPDLLGRAGVRLVPRPGRPDVAITAARGPQRLTAGDSLALEVEVRVTGDTTVDSVAVVATAGDRTLARRRAAVTGGAARLTLRAPGTALPAGTHLVRVALDTAADRAARGRDAEPRTDARLLLVTVTPTPGVVLLADPADWDSRFLFRTLRDVAQFPVRGYVRLERDRWRSMTDLSVVSTDAVRRAARGADLLVLKGGTGGYAEGSGARGVWLWPSGESGATVLPGDWYLAATTTSPLAGAFVGAPVDSFPPAFRLTPLAPPADAWIALTAREGRRGPERAAVVGRAAGRRRELTVAVDGLFRWAFLGGSSEEAYRAWVAAAASWLLGGTDTTQGRARPVRPVVENGLPIVFEWTGPGAPGPLPVTWSAGSDTRSDTLVFDGAGRALAWLPVGTYRYRLQGGGDGLAAIEPYSAELVPHAVTLREKPARPVAAARRTAARDWAWLFGLCVLAFSAEWLFRRRLGLR